MAHRLRVLIIDSLLALDAGLSATGLSKDGKTTRFIGGGKYSWPCGLLMHVPITGDELRDNYVQ